MPYFVTVTGRVDVSALGMILPHEHVVTDLRRHDAPSFGLVDEADVVRVMSPRIEAVRQAGVTCLIECTPGSIGRSVLAMRALSRATGFPIVAAAGVYREALMPGWMRHIDDEQLVERFRTEVMDGLDGTEIVGGFLKLAVSDEGVSELEERAVRAAGRVGAQYGVTVASHTVGGASALREADVLAEEGLPAERFVWVHAQTESDYGYHQELAGRGCYLEYDGVGEGCDLEEYVGWVRSAFERGLQARVLLSQDAGWYQPGEPRGGEQRPYDYLPRVFLPLLRQRGFSQEDVQLLTDANPKRAFARE